MNSQLPITDPQDPIFKNKSIEEHVSNDEDEVKPVKRSGRRKIKIEYIGDKNRRNITFSKRKAGIMKKAYELSTLTGTQVLLLVVSETGLVYTFTTVKLQPIVTKPEGKNLIQACLNTPDLGQDEEHASYGQSVSDEDTAAKLKDKGSKRTEPTYTPYQPPSYDSPNTSEIPKPSLANAIPVSAPNTSNSNAVGNIPPINAGPYGYMGYSQQPQKHMQQHHHHQQQQQQQQQQPFSQLPPVPNFNTGYWHGERKQN
ncbi:transcription factor of the MADS box [Rhizopus azygosporus]|uniref:Transcription factor of the MADS box n=1 Tax=Rhizopus azygosporus TaxID=86630 RepID=A0A367K1F6_RHIAZ|nr:transcription factor of the MADS box [Rhizopus azygosporus]